MDSKYPPLLKLKHQQPPSNEDHSVTDESTTRTSSLDTSAESDNSAETPAVEVPYILLNLPFYLLLIICIC